MDSIDPDEGLVALAAPPPALSEPRAHPLDQRSLPEMLRQILRRRIINDELAAGARLVETSLAEEFQVSRTTVRAALRGLREDGLIELIPRHGCFVTRMDPNDIRDICFARYVLEVGAASEMQVTDQLLGRLDEEISRMGASAVESDMELLVASDTAFHDAIVRSGRSPRVIDLWHKLDSQMGSLVRSSIERQQIDLRTVVQRHRELRDVIAGGDIGHIREALYNHYVAPVEPVRSAGAIGA